MLVMKFGGASVKNAAGLSNVANIVRAYLSTEPLVVVVSAMDKNTNALERLAQLATSGQAPAAEAHLATIEDFHYQIIRQVFADQASEVNAAVGPYFDELRRIMQGVLLLGDFPSRLYDRIMAFGELVSSVILHHTLLFHGISSAWADARQIITTDSRFQQAEVVWQLTAQKVETVLRPLLSPQGVTVVQGYIASNTDGRTTTLGREGSDFTASILAQLLAAERVVIWKDVPAVMSADPRFDAELAKPIARLSYEAAVEMTFYGASVIHPKTIKPLHNLGIPLEVRSFIDPSLPGTQIAQSDIATEHPAASKLHKHQQALLLMRPRDFSFMDERLLRQVFEASHTAGITINLVQISAISLQLVVDDQTERVAAFVSALTDGFTLEMRDRLKLTSYLHHGDNPQVLALAALPSVVLAQRDARHLHVVVPE